MEGGIKGTQNGAAGACGEEVGYCVVNAGEKDGSEEGSPQQ